MFLLDLLIEGSGKGGKGGQDRQGPKRVTIDVGSWWRHRGGEGALGLWLEPFHLGHLLAE